MTYEPKGPRSYASSRSPSDRAVTPLLRDVAFNRHSMNDGQHVSPYDNAMISIGDDHIMVNLVQGLNPEFEQVLSKATRATIGIDLEQRNEDTRDWEEMLQGGLQTALESQVVVFEVSGVSRSATHQIVRSRRAAFHQQSMRASFYGTRPQFRMPESIWNLSDDVRQKWLVALTAAADAYAAACAEDASYQDARFILPEGTTNYILCEYSLREFMNVYAYRGCSMFQWEIVTVMRMMRYLLVQRYKFLDPYIKISCEKTSGSIDMLESERLDPQTANGRHSHTCTFQGWENVEGQCPFPWARESNRQFKSKAHAIG